MRELLASNCSWLNLLRIDFHPVDSGNYAYKRGLPDTYHPGGQQCSAYRGNPQDIKQQSFQDGHGGRNVNPMANEWDPGQQTYPHGRNPQEYQQVPMPRGRTSGRTTPLQDNKPPLRASGPDIAATQDNGEGFQPFQQPIRPHSYHDSPTESQRLRHSSAQGWSHSAERGEYEKITQCMCL